jgi:hypothetical protein
MPIAGVNIARALTNAIGAALSTTGHRAVRGFKRLISSQDDVDLVEKEQPHTATIDLVFRFFCQWMYYCYADFGKLD